MAWSTTFYYQQELRSQYMNSLIKGLIKPGIYNLNATLYTRADEGGNNAQGVWLRINAGSTFVFSNGYKISGGTVTRDLDAIGTYVVKCVADDDMDFRLAQPGGLNTEIFNVDSNSKAIAPILFVYASFEYDELAAGSQYPVFKLAVPNTNSNFTSSMYLPNEDVPVASFAQTVSYLLVGTVLDNEQENAEYVAGNNWRIEVGYNGREAWTKNHVFTARGLPEYRGFLSKNYGQDLSAIIFGPNYNRFYMTPGHFYFNSILYKIDGPTWKELYGQGTPAITTFPDATSGGITDHIYASKMASTYTYAAPVTTGNANKLVVEFLFLAVRSEYSRATTGDLSALFNGTTFATTRRFIPYRITVDAPNGLVLDSRFSLASTFVGVSDPLIPLDICVANINRLKSFLYNRNILLPVIDQMRQAGETASPYLIPTRGESLIPIIISFRQINNGGTDFTDMQSRKEITKFTVVGGASPASAVNPANILSFFEIQASSFAIFSTTLAAQEVFDVLPFLD